LPSSYDYTPLGFTNAKAQALALLADGDIQHEIRDAMSEKNLLAIGDVTPEFVAGLMKRCRGHQYTSRPHDRDRATEVHIFKPLERLSERAITWYIKLYFQEGVIFISVHR
jgi:hypothetical protein